MRAWSLRRRRTVVPPLPSDDLLVTEENLRHALEDVLSVRERQIRGGVIVFRGDLRVDRSRALDELLVRLKPFGYTPFLKAEPGGVMVQAWPLGDLTQAARPGLAVALFILTVLSTFGAGYLFFTGSETFDALRALPFPASLLSGAPFAVTLLTILGVHEFGHYFTARYYGAAVSLPYFIPAPMLFGTFGAVIRMRSPARDRNSLFDIAAAGPLAGLLVALPALVVGLMWSQVATTPANAGFGGFGYSLLTRLFVYWVGCFVTALNLVPVGQLDGGRIAYALSARRHRMLGVVTWVVLLTLGALTGSVNWFVWAALLLFLVGFDHSPPLDDLTPLTPARQGLGIVCLALVILLLPPIPI